jgi:hypothetical protein
MLVKMVYFCTKEWDPRVLGSLKKSLSTGLAIPEMRIQYPGHRYTLRECRRYRRFDYCDRALLAESMTAGKVDPNIVILLWPGLSPWFAKLNRFNRRCILFRD